MRSPFPIHESFREKSNVQPQMPAKESGPRTADGLCQLHEESDGAAGELNAQVEMGGELKFPQGWTGEGQDGGMHGTKSQEHSLTGDD